MSHADPDDTATIEFTVTNARRVDSRTLYALVDVLITVAGIEITIVGVQARRRADGSTSIHLPTTRVDGQWVPAVRIPTETHKPLSDAVLAFLVSEGLARDRYNLPIV